MIARKRICKGLDISVEDLFIDKSATVDMLLHTSGEITLYL